MEVGRGKHTASEEWRAVPGRPRITAGRSLHYEVSNLGHVARILKDGSRRILKTPPDTHGYPRVNLGRGNQKKVHLLVLKAFVGPPPPGHECAHDDGNPANPALTNLAWKTHKENGEDMTRHGSLAGSRSGRSKVTDADVLEIRRRRRDGARYSTLAIDYALSENQIERIVSGYSWGHIRPLAEGVTP